MARGKEAGAVTKMATSARKEAFSHSQSECATTPETNEKLKETAYITCERLG